MDIEQFGKIIDGMIKEHKIQLLITIPENSMEIETQSSFNDPTLDWYIMLHATKKIVKDIYNTGKFDKERCPEMLDGMFEMLKEDILKEIDEEELGE
ncbi:MAG: hypothetical protein IJH64_10035 [Oscillospiraceae bacterium]|nr:hypothetical protein [Oscillospiraceae bacterium]